MSMTEGSRNTLTMLDEARPPFVPEGADFMTALVEIPPGDPGIKPHRHSGPVFGYVVEGEMRFELEGEAPRRIVAGEAFWEPGGDVIHYQAANLLDDAWTRFVVVMVCAPDVPMLTFPDADELAARADRRHPDGAASVAAAAAQEA